ncbi:MAG: porin, Gram-negative type [Polaromonas sp.]|nr:porin, Gram-negative type [Polaromonas sp.]
MKKSLIALAVLAASGVASAQSTVTLYGLVDAYVGTTKIKVSAPGVASTSFRNSVIDSGGFSISRFGLKGSEDLGGGLKANFVLESGFNTDTGVINNAGSGAGLPGYQNPYTGVVSNSVFSRQSWVGLSGGFGELRLGKMFTPYDEVKGLGAAAFDANIFAPATNVWASNGYQDRPGNSIYYSTPGISGFSAAAMYSFGENKTATQNAGSIASGNVQYAGGPLAVALAYQVEKLVAGAPTNKFTQLNGSYDLGAVKLLAAAGHVKNGGATAKEFQFGVDVPLGSALTVSGGVARSKVTGLGGEIKSTGFGLAAKYDFSKRTFLYTGLQLSKNEVVGAGDLKSDTFAVGVQHKF